VKIYTKTGDGGTTSLFGARRVDKNSARIAAYGEVDELNSLIGVILAELTPYPDCHSGERSDSRIDSGQVLRPRSGPFKDREFNRTARMTKQKLIIKKLLRIQSELFVLGADLATPADVKTKVPRITKRYITRLEEEIDSWSDKLPKLRNFILPGGNKVGSKLHLARSVVRRAERAIVDLNRQEKINQNVLIYTNRLSDWFFVLARYINKLENIRENIWKGRG